MIRIKTLTNETPSYILAIRQLCAVINHQFRYIDDKMNIKALKSYFLRSQYKYFIYVVDSSKVRL